MWLLQEAYDKNRKLITLSEAERQFGEWYICPVCGEGVLCSDGEGFYHVEYKERNEECALKWIDIQDQKISNKYKSTPASEYKPDLKKELLEFNKMIGEECDFKEPIQTKLTPKPILNYNDKLISIMRLLSNIDFTQGQKDVINMFLDGVENGFKDKRTYVIQGKPGVGKSFTMSILIKIFELIGYYVKCGTFTGKASQVLRDKGVDSNTLHSLMYKPNIDENGKIISWSKNDNIECDVLYIDEFSMLSKDLIEDIISYNKITIFFGDKNQLMPIGEESMYLENRIDKELNEIVRQEMNNPIIKVLNDILEGVELQKNMKLKTEQGLFATLDLNLNASTIEKLKYEYDVMICGTNKFRHMLNHQYRKHKGYKEYLCEGERIMILKNDKDNGIFNGQVLTVKNVIGKPEMDEAGFTVVNINTDDGVYKISINGLLNPEFDFDDYLFKNKVHKLKEYTKPAFVNYAYAITAHRSQGSEYTKVLVFSQDMKWMLYKQETKEKGREMYKRALFTAISRTKNKCVVVM